MRAAAVLAFVLVGLTSACGADDVTVSVPTGRYEGESTTNSPPVGSATIETPGGSVTVRLGQPLDEIEAPFDSDRPEADVAIVAGGGTFVPVSWDVPSGVVPNPAVWVPTEQTLAERPIRIDLVVDGRRYRVPASPQNSTDDGFVAVAGDNMRLADITAEVTYDGLTQTYDFGSGQRRSGVAEALYAEPRPRRSTCALPIESSRVQVVGSAECELSWRESPYASGLGWAEPGETFVVVDLYTSAADGAWGDSAPGERRPRYYVRLEDAAVRADGRQAVLGPDHRGYHNVSGGFMYGSVFRAPAGRHTFEVSVRGTLQLLSHDGYGTGPRYPAVLDGTV